MQYRLTFTIGRNIDRDGMHIDPATRSSITRQIRQYLTDNFGGATILAGTGIWNGGPRDTVVTEDVTHIIVDAWLTNAAEAQMHAENLAQIALQQSVHMSMAALYACDVSHKGVVIE